MKKYFSVLFFFYLPYMNVFAQVDIEFKRINSYYPGHNIVIIKNKENVNIEVVDSHLQITSDSYVERMLIDNRAGMYSEESIDYSNLEKITKIEAGTFIPQKNKFQNVKVKEFVTKDKISKSVFYDGYKSISFEYPSLQPKSKTYIKFTKVISEPRLFGAFFFQQNIPIVDSEYSITISNDIEIDWRLFNCNDTCVFFLKTINKNNTSTYSWKAHNTKEFHLEEDAPGILYTIPHVRVWIKSYKVNGTTTTLLGTTTDLYKWYYSLTKDVNNEHSPELQALVDSLTFGMTKELDKVKAIYYWVQDNIKYIAIEDGMGGFIPRSGKMVCDRRYGDCKDMASIIHKMLACAKILSHLTWIGSRSIPYRYSDLPTPSVDNHMINTYIGKDKYYFLDATGQNTPFNLSTSFIQGKEALIGIDSSKFEIQKVPEIPYEQNELIDSVEINIVNNKISGNAVSYLSGFFHVIMAEALSGNLKEKTEVLRSYYNKGSNKFLIDSVHLYGLSDRDKNLKIEFVFNIEDYVRHNGEEIYINLNLDKEFHNGNIESKRKMDIEKRYKELLKTIVTLKIPKGYKVGFMPENLKYKNDLFSFDIQYSQSGMKVVQTKIIIINTLIIKKNDFEAWNKMIKELKKAYSEALILKKI